MTNSPNETASGTPSRVRGLRLPNIPYLSEAIRAIAVGAGATIAGLAGCGGEEPAEGIPTCEDTLLAQRAEQEAARINCPNQTDEPAATTCDGEPPLREPTIIDSDYEAAGGTFSRVYFSFPEFDPLTIANLLSPVNGCEAYPPLTVEVVATLTRNPENTPAGESNMAEAVIGTTTLIGPVEEDFIECSRPREYGNVNSYFLRVVFPGPGNQRTTVAVSPRRAVMEYGSGALNTTEPPEGTPE